MRLPADDGAFNVMDATDDDSDDDPLERGSSLAMAMLDASAHSRCDFGVIECCMRIVYPPANDEAGPASSQENTACGRVADEKSASQGFDDDEALGLLIYEVVGGVCGLGRARETIIFYECRLFRKHLPTIPRSSFSGGHELDALSKLHGLCV